MKKQYFFKKNAFIFLKSTFNKIGRRKIARVSRPFFCAIGKIERELTGKTRKKYHLQLKSYSHLIKRGRSLSSNSFEEMRKKLLRITSRKLLKVGAAHLTAANNWVNHRSCISKILSEIFRGPLGTSESFWYRKFLCIKRGVSGFFIEYFLSHSAEQLRGTDLFEFLRNSRFQFSLYWHAVERKFDQQNNIAQFVVIKK